MEIKLTKEQEKILTTVAKPSCSLLKVEAVSGSSKTFMLSKIEKTIKPKNGLYIAYNKSIASEASEKFSSSIDCRTTHSLAYRYTVVPCKLKVGYFNYRDIKDKIHYDEKLIVLDSIKDFCLSKYTTFEEFKETIHISDKLVTITENILSDMASGECTCTHDFYLKLFHIMLVNGDITIPEYDVLFLDEAGDLNPVTLEIFLTLKAKKKVMVGDPSQNIYSFNNTINGFKELKGQGTTCTLSKSFRVAEHIARPLEKFCRDTFKEDMIFKGMKYNNYEINSKAYIARTNSQLINKMIDLNDDNTPYNLVRPVKQIFALPLSLTNLKKNGFISNPEYKYLQNDVDDYYNSDTLQKIYSSALSYIAFLYSDNPNIKTAISLLAKYKAKGLYQAKKIAEKYETSKITYDLTLTTSHSSKGLEWDSVEIATDTNSVIFNILKKDKKTWTEQDYEEFRLAYVAVSRARKEIKGAKFLDKYIKKADYNLFSL